MERTTSATSVAELADASDASDALAFRRALKRRSERTLRRKEQLKERPATPNQPQRRKRNQLLLSFAEMPLGYQCECTKARGFRCGYTAREAALSMFDPNQNEFYNMVTDAAPLLGFAAVPAVLGRYCLSWAPFLRAPPPLLAAFLATATATALQHAASLAAHTFNCCSPRLSHAIWFLDYCGIINNFMWNAPAITMVAFPQAFGLLLPSEDEAAVAAEEELSSSFFRRGEHLLWYWLALNALITPVIFAITGRICYTYEGPATGKGAEAAAAAAAAAASAASAEAKQVRWYHFLLGGGGSFRDVAASALLLLLLVPNLAGTLAAGCVGLSSSSPIGEGDGSGSSSGGGGAGDARALAVLFGLVGGLVVKESRFPEAFFFLGKQWRGDGEASDDDDDDDDDDDIVNNAVTVDGSDDDDNNDDEKDNANAGRGTAKEYGTLDFSPLHSHVVWHLAVIFVQCTYCAIYLRFMIALYERSSGEKQ
jgi:hypothetical protein